jgi:hypothetical protein
VRKKHAQHSNGTQQIQIVRDDRLRNVPHDRLSQYSSQVWSELQVSISLAQLWRALGKMDLRLKKSRSTPANKTAKKAVVAVKGGASS